MIKKRLKKEARIRTKKELAESSFLAFIFIIFPILFAFSGVLGIILICEKFPIVKTILSWVAGVFSVIIICFAVIYFVYDYFKTVRDMYRDNLEAVKEEMFEDIEEGSKRKNEKKIRNR